MKENQGKKTVVPKKRQQRIELWLKPDNRQQLLDWLAQGISETQLAHNMGISRQTLWAWKSENDDLCNIIQEGKAVADTQVMNSLFKRTQGFYYTETKERLNMETGILEVVERNTKYALPDVNAIVFWLKNRLSEEWKDKVIAEEDSLDNDVVVRLEGCEAYCD